VSIDVQQVIGQVLAGGASTWDADDVILYHLGIGAGAPPTDARELQYVYENQLRVLPSFGVLPVFSTIMGVVMLEGASINPMMVLHGEQCITIHKALPTQAKVTNSGRITDVFDKGKGALIVAETETRDEDDEMLCTNRFAIFARGEGGFGGESGPPPANVPPDRSPDLVTERPTLPQQAALYRLSGDRNPLHIDPQMAALGGYDRPILHGLCSYGIVCKEVVNSALDGDVERVASYDVRFSGVVFPGETIVTSMWNEKDKIIVAASCKERDTPIISNAAITIREA
jgi:acyl dehydratase